MMKCNTKNLLLALGLSVSMLTLAVVGCSGGKPAVKPEEKPEAAIDCTTLVGDDACIDGGNKLDVSSAHAKSCAFYDVNGNVMWESKSTPPVVSTIDQKTFEFKAKLDAADIDAAKGKCIPISTNSAETLEQAAIARGDIVTCEKIIQPVNCDPSRWTGTGATALNAIGCKLDNGKCRALKPEEKSAVLAEIARLKNEFDTNGTAIECKSVKQELIGDACENMDFWNVITLGRKTCKANTAKDSCSGFPATVDPAGKFEKCEDLVPDTDNCPDKTPLTLDASTAASLKTVECGLTTKANPQTCALFTAKDDVPTDCGKRLEKITVGSADVAVCTSDAKCLWNGSACVDKPTGSYASCGIVIAEFKAKGGTPVRDDYKKECNGAVIALAPNTCAFATKVAAPTCVTKVSGDDSKLPATCADRFGGTDAAGTGNVCNEAPEGKAVGTHNYSCYFNGTNACELTGYAGCAEVGASTASPAAVAVNTFIGLDRGVNFPAVCTAAELAGGSACAVASRYKDPAKFLCADTALAKPVTCFERKAADPACNADDGKIADGSGADGKCLVIENTTDTVDAGKVCAAVTEVFTEFKFTDCPAVAAASKAIDTNREATGSAYAAYAGDCKNATVGSKADCLAGELTGICQPKAAAVAAEEAKVVANCPAIRPANCATPVRINAFAGADYGSKAGLGAGEGALCFGDGTNACAPLKVGFTNAGGGGECKKSPANTARTAVKAACGTFGDDDNSLAVVPGQCLAAQVSGKAGSNGICKLVAAPPGSKDCEPEINGTIDGKLDDICKAAPTGGTGPVRYGDAKVVGYAKALCASGITLTVDGRAKAGGAPLSSAALPEFCSIR